MCTVPRHLRSVWQVLLVPEQCRALHSMLGRMQQFEDIVVVQHVSLYSLAEMCGPCCNACCADGRRQLMEPLAAGSSYAATADAVAALAATAAAIAGAAGGGFMAHVPAHGALSRFTDPWAEKQQQQLMQVQQQQLPQHSEGQQPNIVQPDQQAAAGPGALSLPAGKGCVVAWLHILLTMPVGTTSCTGMSTAELAASFFACHGREAANRPHGLHWSMQHLAEQLNTAVVCLQ